MSLDESIVEILSRVRAQHEHCIISNFYVSTAHYVCCATQGTYSEEEVLAKLKERKGEVKISEGNRNVDVKQVRGFGNLFTVSLAIEKNKNPQELTFAFRGSYDVFEKCIIEEIKSLNSYGFSLHYSDKFSNT